MERLHRLQPMVEDVLFVSTAKEQFPAKEDWRGMEGGEIVADLLPVDPMVGLQVPTIVPEGYYAEPAKVDAPSQDATETESEN